MPTPTPDLLRNQEFVTMMQSAFASHMCPLESDFLSLLKSPKFSKTREVHARRARKLRRRGESVRFLIWQNGHCVYGWGGPMPDTIKFRLMPPKKVEPTYTQICYSTHVRWYIPDIS